MCKIAIIGGGASGLVCAIEALKNKNEVIIFDKEEKAAKKILVTGNGRCNYFNEDMSLDHFHSTSVNMNKYIDKDLLKEVISFFESIGIVPKIKNGYYYPNSNQASSIREALLIEVKRLKGQILTNREVIDIKKDKDKYLVKTNAGEILFDKVVLATGTHAGLKTKTNGYDLAKKFNHTIVDVLPSLVQLQAKEKFLNAWSGIRSDVCIHLYEDGNLIKEETGEIQLTNYGISGICVFNLSSFVSRGLLNKKQEHVIIDFLPSIKVDSINDFIEWINKRNDSLVDRSVFELFEGILNNKLVSVILKRSKIQKEKRWYNLTVEEKRNLAKNIKFFPLDITGVNPYSKAQVCSGGVTLEEIDYNNFESKLAKGLYIIGEMLDIDGDCGGYNLTFAWISGMKCGRSL